MEYNGLVKDFAIKYVGAKVKIAGNHCPIRSPLIANFARVVGYTKNFVVVEYLEDKMRRKSFPVDAYDNIHFVIDEELSNLRCWEVSLKNLELCESFKPVVPYPNICKVCKSPARKTCSVVLCSNNNCKSKLKVLSLTKMPKFNYVLCAICKDPAQSALRITTRKYKMRCSQRHPWLYSIKEGDNLCKMDGKYYIEKLKL